MLKLTKLATILSVSYFLTTETAQLTPRDAIASQYIADSEIDHSNIYQSKIRIFLDIGVIVTQEAIKYFLANNINQTDFLKGSFTAATKILLWSNIYLSVVNIEFWSRGNKVVLPDPGEINLLYPFVSSRLTQYDALVFLHNFSDGRSIGYGIIGTVCTPGAISMLTVNHFPKYSKGFGELIAHELGHNLGFQHTDGYKTCRCLHNDDKYCVMYSNIVPRYTSTPKSYDDCSIKALLANLKNTYCLKVKMMPLKRLFKTCGDGRIDLNEECDCASLDRCMLTPLGRNCNMTTCTFINPRCQCYSGTCCKNCMFVPNKLCRSAVNNCDSPEYCTGSDDKCPPDDYYKNFTSCKKRKVKGKVSSTGICLNGICSSFTQLCRKTYNEPNLWFSRSCVEKMQHFMTYNCTKYYKFKMRIPMCVTLPNVCQHFVCTSPDEVPYNTTGLQYKKNTCFVQDLTARQNMLLRAPNYMPCDVGKFCINGTCIKTSNTLKHGNNKAAMKNSINTNNKGRSLVAKHADGRTFENAHFDTEDANDNSNMIVNEKSANLSLLVSIIVSGLLLAIVVCLVLIQRSKKAENTINL